MTLLQPQHKHTVTEDTNLTCGCRVPSLHAAETHKLLFKVIIKKKKVSQDEGVSWFQMEVSCVVTSVRYVSQSCLHTHTLGHSPTQRDTVRETETGWSGGGRKEEKENIWESLECCETAARRSLAGSSLVAPTAGNINYVTSGCFHCTQNWI